jgi:hypothetical protein
VPRSGFVRLPGRGTSWQIIQRVIRQAFNLKDVAGVFAFAASRFVIVRAVGCIGEVVRQAGMDNDKIRIRWQWHVPEIGRTVAKIDERRLTILRDTARHLIHWANSSANNRAVLDTLHRLHSFYIGRLEDGPEPDDTLLEHITSKPLIVMLSSAKTCVAAWK